MLYNVSIWEERVMPFGTGIVKSRETLWDKATIIKNCYNAAPVFCKGGIKGINGINVIERFSGSCYLNQIYGYNRENGLFSFLINPDGTINRTF